MGDALTAERLVRLGLTQYGARAYIALVRRDGSTAAEVAKLAGVPRTRIYDVLDDLHAKGLAGQRPGRTAKYVASPPSEAIPRLVAAQHERVRLLEADAAAVQDELGRAFEAGNLHRDPLDYIELIRSRSAIAKRLDELQASVTREMLVLSKLPAAVPVEANESGLAVARGHTLRTVYESSLLDDPVARDGIRRFIDAGEQARFADKLPMKLGIIDERIVMIAMSDPVAGEPGLTTLIVENTELAACLKIAFEQIWRTAISFNTAYRRQRDRAAQRVTSESTGGK